MTDNQRLFADEYIRNGRNATRAYLKAYPHTKNENTAHTLAGRLLRNVAVSAYITERLDAMSCAAIADAGEIMAFYTSMMRGQIEDAKASDRNNAAEKLARMLGVDSKLEREKFEAQKSSGEADMSKLDALLKGIDHAAQS